MNHYTVVPRSYPDCGAPVTFERLAEAIAFGRKGGKPFDVVVDSGAVVWSWTQRDDTPAEAHVRGHTPDRVEIRDSSANWLVLDDGISGLLGTYRRRWGVR